MSIHLTAMLAGLIGGYFSSAPIGPINLWIVQRTMTQCRFRELMPFISGVILADVSLAAASVWGYTQFFEQSEMKTWLAYIGGAVVLAIGVGIIVSERKFETDPDALMNSFTGKPRDFLTGLSFCGLNPAFFAFWLIVIDHIVSLQHVRPSGSSAYLFLTSIAVGDGLWFWTIHKAVKKGVNIFSDASTRKIRFTIGLVFVIIGISALTTQFWSSN